MSTEGDPKGVHIYYAIPVVALRDTRGGQVAIEDARQSGGNTEQRGGRGQAYRLRAAATTGIGKTVGCSGKAGTIDGCTTTYQRYSGLSRISSCSRRSRTTFDPPSLMETALIRIFTRIVT